MYDIWMLIRRLRDPDCRVRMEAAKKLGDMKDASAVPHLVGALKDEDAGVRQKAVMTLGKIGDASAVPGLLDILGDEDSDVRSMAVWVLGRLDGDSHLPIFVDMLKDPHATVRWAAAATLDSIIRKKAGIEEMGEIETLLAEGLGTFPTNGRESDPAMEAAKLLRMISERRNELATGKDILLDGKPSPPKEGKMYSSVKRGNGIRKT